SFFFSSSRIIAKDDDCKEPINSKSSSTERVAHSAMFFPFILQDKILSFNLCPLHRGQVLVITIFFKTSFRLIFSFDCFFKNAFSIRGIIPSYLTVFPHSLLGFFGLCSVAFKSIFHSSFV